MNDMEQSNINQFSKNTYLKDLHKTQWYKKNIKFQN